VAPGAPWTRTGLALALFAGGLVAILAALVSPVDVLGDQLLVMHMVQHLLLIDIAPILLILGFNKVLLRPVTRRLHAIERRAGYLAHPAFAVLAYAGFMWAWHIPAMYDAALHNATVHALEHVCFGLAGGLYWWHLLSPIRSRMRMGGLGPVAYMVSTKLLVGALGIVLAFAPASFYPFYEHHPHYWGLSPSTDQSMAGLVMALEQSIVMGIALVVVFVQMLRESEREAQRAERYEVSV
jgi:cytochrome c oxidase assembly factor CtaG